MKKLFLLCLILPLLSNAQTVPNGNFESWSWADPLSNPEFWETDNTPTHITVTKDFEPYEGEIAMRVTALPVGTGEFGEASTTFEIDAIPAALNFYAKTETENGSVSVVITFLNQDIEVYTEEWFSTDSMPNYTLVSIPLEQIEPFITHARIKVSAQVGDFAPGSAWISVDTMAFGEPTSVDEQDRSGFKIYPNPASHHLTIEAEQPLGNLTITDVRGRVVFEKRISDGQTTLDIHRLVPGVYTLRDDQNSRGASTFIVK